VGFHSLEKRDGDGAGRTGDNKMPQVMDNRDPVLE